MGQVFNFLNDNDSFGCLRKAYQSVHHMEKDSLLCDKNDLLKPKIHLSRSSVPSLLNIENSSIFIPAVTLDSCTSRSLYTCGCATPTFCGSRQLTTCGHCKQSLFTTVTHYVRNLNPTYVDGKENGFVKGGVVKYIVTDDLFVSSKSSFSFLEYFKTMHIVDLNELEEKAVTLNLEKCKKLLKLALISKHMVLTKFFKDEVGF